MPILEGTLRAEGLRIGILVSRFNERVTKALLEGALEALRRMGASTAEITTVWVPGALELPLAAKALAESGRYDALIALGAVIRGETAHFEYVAGGAANGLASVAQSFTLPIGFGVLTTEDEAQAFSRAGGKGGNKGAEAAQAAVEMATLLRELKG